MTPPPTWIGGGVTGVVCRVRAVNAFKSRRQPQQAAQRAGLPITGSRHLFPATPGPGRGVIRRRNMSSAVRQPGEGNAAAHSFVHGSRIDGVTGRPRKEQVLGLTGMTSVLTASGSLNGDSGLDGRHLSKVEQVATLKPTLDEAILILLTGSTRLITAQDRRYGR